MKKEKRKKLFEVLRLNFPGIKEISLSFYADCDSFDSFSYVCFDGDEVNAKEEEKVISIVEDFIWANIFNGSEFEIDVYNRGSEGYLVFDIENNKIEYSITYYNNPNYNEDEDEDDDYEKNYKTTF